MDDYISREDALRAVEDIVCDADDAERTCDRIIDLPSADVAPVRHGRWKDIEWWVNPSGAIIIGRLYQCSKCGRIIDLEHGETLDDYPYCHCGTKMDGGINDK